MFWFHCLLIFIIIKQKHSIVYIQMILKFFIKFFDKLVELIFTHVSFSYPPLKIKYYIYVYLEFKLLISEVVSLKNFGPVPHPIGGTRGGGTGQKKYEWNLK